MSETAVVLCRVESSGNVGAICRAMATMGLRRLVFADCPVFDELAVRTWSLAAWSLYEQAEHYSSLTEALAGFSYAAAFSRRAGRKRKETLDVRTWADLMVLRQPEKLALVFGNERDGLSSAELAVCDDAVAIPTDELLPSLNISHAVQLAAWELRRQELPLLPGGRQSAARAQIDRAVQLICNSMEANGLFKLGGREDTGVFLRELSARAGLSDTELARLQKLLTKHAVLGRIHE
ncbi:MAG: RNA methyltransferase [Spirochaetes bacterium]|nr:RNA methyltransferase [Spirochaetota bacterium]MBU0955385.1 RNA methyltransferase [Spirochaetota bacterium]